jgi:hypothetical protein
MTVFALTAEARTAFDPGRSCPLSYRYTPASLAELPTTEADTLYCVGGLYGNLFALDALESLLVRERGDTQVVFNGDFHWFDATPDAFASVELRTTIDPRYLRLRGNVETEISQDIDAGCGCAYPEHVDDGTVERSNDIARILRSASLAHPTQRMALGELPMSAAFRVGKKRVVAVHGDFESLAGWRFDPNSLDQPNSAQRAKDAMVDANADIAASSHTCLPALRTLAGARQHVIVNNGAAGLPCFSETRYGIVTRISHEPAASANLASLYGVRCDELFIEAIALEFDFDAWRARFLSLWPAGSAAHESYFTRIESGVNFSFDQALGRSP